MWEENLKVFTTLLTLVFTLNHNAHSSYEDLRALDGGADGLSVIIPIMKFASEHLVEGGLVLLEVDPCHPLILGDELEKQNLGTSFRIIEVCKDFCDRDRFMVLQKQSKP